MKERSDTLRTACKDFEEDLVLYYYGDDSEAERSRVESHLPSCASCHAFLDDLRKLLPQMVKPTERRSRFGITTSRNGRKASRQEQRKYCGGTCWPMRAWMLPASEPLLLPRWRQSGD
jgi:hypothetical protein